ncbi:hypothetical protein Q5752_002001 [Cryptotrichosporon argae]
MPRIPLDPAAVAVPDPHAHPPAVRAAYIRNLAACVRACVLRGDVARARRAWALLVRCREVDWRERWHWGLYLLNAVSESVATAASGQGRQGETYLKTLQIASAEGERPMILHALVLHLIQHDRHRDALSELETYLPSYPYLSSSTLHTYAGMLAFYLAQPVARRRTRASRSRAAQPPAPAQPQWADDRARGQSVMTVDSELSAVSVSSADGAAADLPNESLVRQARAYFARSLALDPADAVATEFVRMMDAPDKGSEDEGDESDGKEDDADTDGLVGLDEGAGEDKEASEDEMG